MADDNNDMVEAAAAGPPPDLPDYLTNPNAVVGDANAEWRYGKPPDYSKTRREWERTKQMSHVAGSLPQLVENLVKSWEIEASFKPRLQDWRTIDHAKYSFAMNGGPPQSAEHMLKVGTYNAIICPNEYYSPEHSDFAASHKTFKRMMPTFAWEVLEVYSGPPTVAFKWRHWGEMKSDYVAFNDKGEKVTAKAHGGPIEIFGVTVAKVDDKVRLQAVETWMDPLSMFRQIAPCGIVNKEIVDQKDQTVETNGTVNDINGYAPDREHLGPGQSIDQILAAETLPSSVFGNLREQTNADGTESWTTTPCPFFTQSAATTELMPVSAETYGSALEVEVPRANASLDVQGSDTMHDMVAPFQLQFLSPTSIQTTVDHDICQEPILEEDIWHEAAEMSLGHAPATDPSDVNIAPDAKRPRLSDTISLSEQRAPGNAIDAMSEQSPDIATAIYTSSVTGKIEEDLISPASTGSAAIVSIPSSEAVHANETNATLLDSAIEVRPVAKDLGEKVVPDPGEAVVAPRESQEVREAYKEMSTVTPIEKDNLMNQE